MAAVKEAPLHHLGLRHRPGTPFISYIGIKPHQHADSDQYQGTAAFITGLPLGFNEAVVTDVFSCFGEVTQVVLHRTKRSGMVVFAEPSCRDLALKTAVSGQVVEYFPPEEEEGATGVKAWVRHHKALRPGHEALQKQLDAWVAAHEEEEERKRRAAEAALAEDGWTVVVRGKGRARAREGAGGGSVVSGGVAKAAAEAVAAAKKRKRDEPAVNFYRFQAREKRRNELLELRQRFDEDRKRISQLRSTRNFRPQ